MAKEWVWSSVGPGQTSNSVKIVQKGLIKLGFHIAAGATGFWGAQTQTAFNAFRRSIGLRGDDAVGAPGPYSLGKLAKAAGFTIKQVSPAPAPHPGGRVSSPVPGHGVNYAYGVRNSRYAAGFHTGEDHAAPTGTPVVAVRGGTVAWSNGAGGAYGNWIGLRADNGRVYVYCHLSSRSVSAGQRVKAGQQLGRVGATGNVTGPHLHFEDHPAGGFVYGRVRKPSW